jgi:hypothetical protein
MNTTSGIITVLVDVRYAGQDGQDGRGMQDKMELRFILTCIPDGH